MLTWARGRADRRAGRGRGAHRRGRLEERGAPARAVAPVFSLLDLRRRRRGTLPARAAPRRGEGHVAWVRGPHGGRAPRGGGGTPRRPEGGRGGDRAAGGSWQARSARDAPRGGENSRRPPPRVPGRLPAPRRH